MKIGLLALVAALAFALPATFIGGTTPVSAARDGDVCGLWANRAQVGGKYLIPVGQEFSVLARIQDNFRAILRMDADNPDDQNSIGPRRIDDIKITDQFVRSRALQWSIDSQTGEAKITDRVEDPQNAVGKWLDHDQDPGRHPTETFWDSPIEWGIAEDNHISPVDVLHNVAILTVNAFGDEDNDFPGDVDSADLAEQFINIAPTAADQAFAAVANTDCGSQLLSIAGISNATFSIGDQNAIFGLMQTCQIGQTTGGLIDVPHGSPGPSPALQQQSSSDACEALDNWLSAWIDSWDDIEAAVEVDGWSEISVTCTKPGQVKITADPTLFAGTEFKFVFTASPNSGADASDDESFVQSDLDPSRYEGRSIDIECIGTSYSATITASPTSVEIRPVGTSKSQSLVVITVVDANKKRLDGASVRATVNNCGVANNTTGPFTSQQAVTTTDTDVASDLAFQSQHAAAGDELGAGTAEFYIDCNVAGATAGSVVLSYIVDNIGIGGSGLSGTTSIKVVGPPAALKIEATPATSTCGNPVQATATVVDSTGQPVSDGTQVVFTTTTATGSQGGSEGAQGAVATTNGVASITLSIDPMDAGTHTVSARTGGTDLTGAPVNVVSNSTTIACSLAAAAAAPPVVTAPKTGTGPSDTTVSGIRPPNTGDAGLAGAGNGSSWASFALFGLVVTVVVGFASVKFARR